MPNLLCGIQGSVKVGTISFSFNKYSIKIQTAAIVVNNFNSGGYQQVCVGVTKADVDISGPYDGGNMPFSSGTSYTFIFGFSTMLTLSIPTQLTGITLENDYDGSPRVSLTGTSTGAFTAAIA